MARWIVLYKDPALITQSEFSVLTTQLDRIERRLQSMSEMEDRLDSVITSVQATVSSVVGLVGQVLDKLQAAGDSSVDLTDETATLEGLQTDLQTAADNMQSALDDKAAATEPAPSDAEATSTE